MANLTLTAYWTRILVRYSALIIGGILIGQWLISTSYKIYILSNPPKETATTRYGKLSPIVFPKKDFVKKVFTLELPNDNFPKVPEQMPVYVVYRPNSTVLALENETKAAKGMGFVDEPTEISSGVYEFQNTAFNQTLDVNVLDGSFTMKYPYLNDQLLVNPDSMPTKEQAISKASEYLERAGKLYPDLKDGKKQTSYYKISFDKLEPLQAAGGSNIVRVDFFRKPIEVKTVNYDIVNTEPLRAAVSVLVSGSNSQGKSIVDVNYKFIDVSRESFSTYPIKTPQAAWSELQSGNYWPVADTDKQNVSIKELKLAYFEPSALTNFMQPVYVFSGEKGAFVAYVPAVQNQWIASPSSTNN